MQAIEFAFDVTNTDVFVAGSQPVPAGTYVAAITDMQGKANSQPDSGHNLACVFTIIEGEYKGRKIYENLNIWHKTSTAARDIAMKQLSSIGHAVGVLSGSDLTVLCHKPMMVEVDLTPQQPDGVNPNTGEPVKGRGPSNNVIRHDPINSNSTAQAQPHIPQSQPVNNPNVAQAQAAPTFAPGQQAAPANQAPQNQQAAPAQTTAQQAAPAAQSAPSATPPWLNK